jgi:hypothetical protein
MVPRSLVMRARLVTDRAMPVGRRGELLLDQRSAAIVPHDLPIGHAMARTDRLFGKMHCGRRLLRRPPARMRSSVMRASGGSVSRTGTMVGATGVVVASVDPAVTRTRARHWREGRRWRQLLRLGRRSWRHRVGCRLLGWGPGPARRLLRSEWRCQHPKRQRCAGKDDDSLHVTLPQSAGADACGEPGEDRQGTAARQH